MHDRTGRALPSARAVSNAVHVALPNPHIVYTHMLMQFGQFLDHDLTLAPMTLGSILFSFLEDHLSTFRSQSSPSQLLTMRQPTDALH